MVGPGEPEFLPEDTELAVALALEERDTCPSCGMPKAWCRNSQGGERHLFDVQTDYCWATHRVAEKQQAQVKEKVDPVTQRAQQMSARFRAGYEPDITAGLDLPEDPNED